MFHIGLIKKWSLLAWQSSGHIGLTKQYAGPYYGTLFDKSLVVFPKEIITK